MTKAVTAAEVEGALVAAVPGNLTFSVERSNDMVCVTLPRQGGIPWDIHVGWEGVPGEGEHLLWIFSDPFKYEEMSLEAPDYPMLDRFKGFVNDLLKGVIAIEITRFRSSGKLWRTRLIDYRRPEGEQVAYRYYRRVFRWWRPVRTEILKLGTPDKSSEH